MPGPCTLNHSGYKHLHYPQYENVLYVHVYTRAQGTLIPFKVISSKNLCNTIDTTLAQ